MGLAWPKKKVFAQKPMTHVCLALAPTVLASIYLFGWRSLAVLALVTLLGFAAEAAFTYPNGKPVTSAVFVTCLIFHLSLPPTIPFWMATIGIIFAVVMGKMVFGGFGQNVFNPAMVGRCFLYITFPVQMTNAWATPIGGAWGGFLAWAPMADAMTRATPLTAMKAGAGPQALGLFTGQVAGSLGETSAVLILIGGAWLVYKKIANWRLAGSFILGGASVAALLLTGGALHAPGVLETLLAGSFLFGAAFIITEPVSGAKTKPAQWIYGLLAGGLVVILRQWSNFAEGVMFSILILNAFAPLMDQSVKQLQDYKKARKAGAQA